MLSMCDIPQQPENLKAIRGSGGIRHLEMQPSLPTKAASVLLYPLTRRQPFVLDNQVGDKVLGFLGDAFKGLLVEIPVGRQYVVESFCITVPQERGESTQPGRRSG